MWPTVTVCWSADCPFSIHILTAVGVLQLQQKRRQDISSAYRRGGFFLLCVKTQRWTARETSLHHLGANEAANINACFPNPGGLN